MSDSPLLVVMFTLEQAKGLSLLADADDGKRPPVPDGWTGLAMLRQAISQHEHRICPECKREYGVTKSGNQRTLSRQAASCLECGGVGGHTFGCLRALKGFSR